MNKLINSMAEPKEDTSTWLGSVNSINIIITEEQQQIKNVTLKEFDVTEIQDVDKDIKKVKEIKHRLKTTNRIKHRLKTTGKLASEKVIKRKKQVKHHQKRYTSKIKTRE